MNEPSQTPLADRPEPPVCIHILGQGLATALWKETQILKARIKELELKMLRLNLDPHEKTNS